MTKEFINYNQALELKELGFDEPCFKYIYIGDTGNNFDHYLEVKPSESKNHNDDDLCISQPTFSQAFRFFREKYGYNCFVTKSINSDKWYYYREDLSNRKNDSEPELTDKYDTYEEAESAGLNKLIEICRKIKENDDMISSDIVGY